MLLLANFKPIINVTVISNATSLFLISLSDWSPQEIWNYKPMLIAKTVILTPICVSCYFTANHKDAVTSEDGFWVMKITNTTVASVMAIRYIVNPDWQSSVSYSVSQSRRRKINRWHNWYGPSMHTTTIVSDTAIDQSDYWLLISRATHMIDCSIHVSVDWCIISLKINKSGSTQTQQSLPDITFTHLFWILYNWVFC